MEHPKVEYPKLFMKKSELEKMGFPEEFLMNAYRYKGQRFAQKVNSAVKNSPIFFNTEGFEKWRRQQLEIENAALHSG